MQRSTGKASKLRRDQINSEIETLRHLLPLPSAVKARLSYLQVMSLACVYIRTGNFFSSYTKGMDQEHHYTSFNGGGVLKLFKIEIHVVDGWNLYIKFVWSIISLKLNSNNLNYTQINPDTNYLLKVKNMN